MRYCWLKQKYIILLKANYEKMLNFQNKTEL